MSLDQRVAERRGPEANEKTKAEETVVLRPDAFLLSLPSCNIILGPLVQRPISLKFPVKTVQPHVELEA